MNLPDNYFDKHRIDVTRSRVHLLPLPVNDTQI